MFPIVFNMGFVYISVDDIVRPRVINAAMARLWEDVRRAQNNTQSSPIEPT